MRSGTKSQGYTILEVMIFMAVSGLMFVVAATAVSGKQARAEFKQGMGSVSDQVRQSINDVSNGYFPSAGNFKCVPDDTAPDIGIDFVSNNGARDQGKNQGCVFIGKIIHFTTGDTARFNVYTLGGRQFAVNTTRVPTNLQESYPKIARENGVDLTESEALRWGLKFEKAFTVTNGTATSTKAVAFTTSFASYGGLGLNSGTQHVSIIPLPAPGATLVAEPASNTPEALNAYFASLVDVYGGFTSADTVYAHPITVVCFTGGSGEWGSVTIGDENGQRLTTNMKIGKDEAAVGCTESQYQSQAQPQAQPTTPGPGGGGD